MKKQPLVSIIIVSWNGKELLKECLASLKSIYYKATEIIVVDNGSVDGSQEFIKSNYPKIKLVENKTNLGFAKANNIGFEYAKGEMVLFLNNDTALDPNFLAPLVDELYSKEDVGVVQPKLLNYKDKKTIDSIGSFLTNTGLLYHFGYHKEGKEKIFNQKMDIYSAKGACMLFKKSVLDKVGLLDEDYFAYFEETDLCHRVWLAGYKIRYVPSSVIYHKGGETSNKMASSFVQYHSYKNRIATFIKNLGALELFKIIPQHLILCELSSLVFLIQGNINVSLAIQRAIWWNIINLKDLLGKRKKIQKEIRKIDDSKFMKSIKRDIDIKYLYYLFTGLENMPVNYYIKHER